MIIKKEKLFIDNAYNVFEYNDGYIIAEVIFDNINSHEDYIDSYIKAIKEFSKIVKEQDVYGELQPINKKDEIDYISVKISNISHKIMDIYLKDDKVMGL